MKTFNEKNKVLKVAATPIGNLSEVNLRLLQAFEDVEYILCEDTRVTRKLLQLLEIQNKPELISYHKFSEEKKLAYAIDLILHHHVLLVSDAGYPLVSDPGYLLIKACKEKEIAIEVINGPSAVLHSLVVSGFKTNSFYFLGFLGDKSSERIHKLKEVKSLNTTLIIFEAVHRIKQTILDCYTTLGNQKVCLCRELSKLNEEIINTTLEKLSQTLDTLLLKGEFVIVIENEPSLNQPTLLLSHQALEKEIKGLLNNKTPTKQIVNTLKEQTKLSDKELYNLVLKYKNE